MRTLQIMVALAILATPSATAAELHMCEGSVFGRVCDEFEIEGPIVDPEEPAPMPQLPDVPEVPDAPSAPEELPIVGEPPSPELPDSIALPDPGELQPPEELPVLGPIPAPIVPPIVLPPVPGMPEEPIVPGLPSLEAPELPDPGEINVPEPNEPPTLPEELDLRFIVCNLMPAQFPVVGRREPIDRIELERMCEGL